MQLGDVVVLLTGFVAILTIGAWWAGRPSAAARDARARNPRHADLPDPWWTR